ncbi:MAG: FKBP-type peptidyl-prolyl cis-trans isomerase [Longimicrobiales bacterium]
MQVRTTRRSLPTLALACVLAAACSSEPSGPSVEPQVIEEVQFAASLGIDLNEFEKLPSSGIYIKDLIVGQGEQLIPQDLATIEYTMWLADGRKIFEGRRTWQLGNFEQPLGLEYGSLFMRVGGVRRMIVPPAIGWGDQGSPDGLVPPGAILIFEVELTDVR